MIVESERRRAAMNSEAELRRHVFEELDSDPTVDASEIGVTIEEGVVTLRGAVRSYAEKYAAGRAVKRVQGVRELRNEVRVHVAGPLASDEELARRVRETLRWNSSVPDEAIEAVVQDGWVTLQGTASWHFQRRWAERLVQSLAGIRGVSNRIAVQPEAGPDADAIRDQIGAAFLRSAELGARRIDVDVEDGRVILRGSVGSWAERREAERAAWAAPGVHEVVNELKVRTGSGIEPPPPGA